ncbi:hypothetical protein J2Z65_004629 [Paenibacillus aceris]|uniref:Uncharacterized protein n=1 Tax=Paenibacillus aceris TaxID=869555 RepID=A0ABS4I381_9BACL|nr:hypothetical protein [Paenibacillus aceris]
MNNQIVKCKNLYILHIDNSLTNAAAELLNSKIHWIN